MTYPNLLCYYIAQGGEGAHETAFGVPSWDSVGDPHREHPVAVKFNHHNRDVLAVTGDGRVALVGTVTADADPRQSSRCGSRISTGHGPFAPCRRSGSESAKSTAGSRSRNSLTGCPGATATPNAATAAARPTGPTGEGPSA